MKEQLKNDPEVKKALRVLYAKGVTIKQVEEVYRYYERIKTPVKPEYVIEGMLKL